ncbi:MAG: ATP-dependent acyl-CoA ligase [Alphaproteobacteria bacterium]|nr:ATP-dependent acyl-CoA ligase [Alphaproteobacteria bacterium]
MALDPRARQTVAQVLADRVARHGDRALIRADDGDVTYRAMDGLSNRFAQGLARLGVGPGVTVLVMLPNVVEFVALFIALAKLGAIQVPVNTAYRGALLAHVINDSQARLMIIDAGFMDRLAEAAENLGQLERLLPFGTETARHPSLDRLPRVPFAALREAPDVAPAGGPSYRDLIAIMYTSGTTGASKGVMITHAHAYNYAHGGHDKMDLGEGDVYFAPLPLFHIAGQWAVVYACMITGATAAITRRFSVETFWRDAARVKATATFLLGAMANFLDRQPPRPDDALTPITKAMVVPLFPEIDGFRKRFGVKVVTTYGSTEVSAPMILPFDHGDWRSCGRLNDELYEARIVDQHDEEVPNGTVGEFVIRPREPWVLMAGYWRNPEGTVAAWRNGWLHSGDALFRDAEGFYYFADRLRDSIRRRGENISSMEVETEVNAHPAVLESAVFPVPSEVTDDEVMAAIVVKEGMTLDPVDLIRFLEPRMARFMVPRYVLALPALPKTPTGKIQKFELRKAGVTPDTWDREATGITLKR